MKKSIISILAVATILVACEKEPVVQDNSAVSLSETVINASPDGGVYEVTVTSDSGWRVSGYSDWVRPTAEEGKSGDKLKFDVDPSDSKEEKTAQFKVFSGSAVETLTIVSKPAFVMHLLSEPQVEYTSDGASLNIKLDTNIPEIESAFTASWIEFVKREELFGNTVISFNVLANETYKERSSEITLSGQGKSVKVAVSQKQLDAVITSTPKVVFEGLGAGQVKFTVRANVEYTYTLPEWLTLVSETKGSMDAEGLVPTEIVLSFGANMASRIADISFVSDGKVMLNVAVKQQNPNAVLCNIPDSGLRSALGKMGWVLASEASDECEILENGLTSTSLSLSGSSIKSVYGLGAFPELKTLTVSSTGVSVFDVSDCRKLEEVDAPLNTNLTEVKLGKAPVVKFNTNSDGAYVRNYFSATTVTVSSEYLKELNLRSFDCMYLYYYDNCTTIDVSACPALEKLDAYRIYTLWGNYRTYLTKIYVSQAQMDAYNAGKLQIERVVKTPDHHEEAALVVK
ncbi:MAG: BACON domain-containing protein [Candidatus Cryptobacteroides sp.]